MSIIKVTILIEVFSSMTSYFGSFLDNIVIIKLMSWQIVNRWNQNYEYYNTYLPSVGATIAIKVELMNFIVK